MTLNTMTAMGTKEAEASRWFDFESMTFFIHREPDNKRLWRTSEVLSGRYIKTRSPSIAAAKTETQALITRRGLKHTRELLKNSLNENGMANSIGKLTELRRRVRNV